MTTANSTSAPLLSPQTIMNLLKDNAEEKELVKLKPTPGTQTEQHHPHKHSNLKTYGTPIPMYHKAEDEGDYFTDSDTEQGHFITTTAADRPLQLSTNGTMQPTATQTAFTDEMPPQVGDIMSHPDHQEFSDSDTELQLNHVPWRDYTTDPDDPHGLLPEFEY